MATVLILAAVLGCIPLLLGMLRLVPNAVDGWARPTFGSILSCTLAFNLTFFWQELWLVIPKALVPGLHPILYHNDHDWTGSAPVAELLQGTGAVATFALGVTAFALLALSQRTRATLAVFLFWLAFQGIFQSLTQIAVGMVLRGNDVGRALTYMGTDVATKHVLLALCVMAMAISGMMLSAFAPAPLIAGGAQRSRSFGASMLATAVVCVMLSIPYRIPRDPVEVLLIPALVNLVGTGWLVLGRSIVGYEALANQAKPRVIVLMVALAALLLMFQLVFRPGIRFY